MDYDRCIIKIKGEQCNETMKNFDNYWVIDG